MNESSPFALIGRGLSLLLGNALGQTDQWTDLLARLAHIQEAIMATTAELQASIETLASAVTDYTSDVTVALQKMLDAQAAMQATLDAAIANDVADAAMIASLQAQLAAMTEGADAAVASVTALTDAIAAADVAVEPAP